ncbi:MAG: ribonuclease R, partial [Clostridia bacterium]|nr:ribonuclease R [Clostridia bacterium]
MEIRKILIDGFKSGKLANKSLNEIPRALRLSPNYKKAVKTEIKKLCAEYVIIKDGSGHYSTPEQAGAFYAKVKANPQGYAFLIPDGKAEREHDYFVPKRRLGGALDGDKVYAVPMRGTEDEAVVIKILERGKRSVVGRLQIERHSAYVLPDDRAFDSDVYIPLSLLNGAEDGDKVVAEITSYPKGKPVGGKILEVLGKDGDFFTEEDAIIRGNGLREEFPDFVEETAQKVAEEKVVLRGRRDLRELLTITIDGVDTRDIDDAVSLEIIDGKYRLGVHIADVSHYVKPNGCIDKEAYARGTSVYFPDRVLPMLPKALSNGACSLNEGENRYATSCFMTFDKYGNKLDGELCESVIRSDKRMTYDEVTEILDGKKSDRDYPLIAPMLREMEKLCLLLEGKRTAAGEVSLDVKEAHIYLNERGEIVIPEYQRALSHRMIEQFM